MKTVCDVNRCNGCMACVDICPKHCISIKDNFFTQNAVKDMRSCIKCGQCEEICPNNTIVEKRNPIEWHQGWAELETRRGSSSGGAASAIIKFFIQSGGYVASCLFNKGVFLFDITNDLEVSKQFAGSKYVKSNPIGIYKKVQERLKTDKVLFIGLPCQVAGLKNFIKNHDNLYTIDLICHGTPSVKLLELFLEERNIILHKCSDVKFRTDVTMGMVVDGKILSPEGLDDYLITFLDSVDYTENCYYCQFASFNRVSDITLGDSWGTEYKDEEKKGISLILIQSEKGKELVKASDLELKDVDVEVAKKENHQLRHPSIMNPERDTFLGMISQGKSFAYSTFILYKKQIIKRHVKWLLIKLGIRK